MNEAGSAKMVPGYHGRYLHVDVGAGVAKTVPLPPLVLRRFLGGSGLGTWLLLREQAAKHSPLSAAASLAFVFSPLVGSPLTTSAKFAVVSKSPLTDRLNDSLASSRFAIAGKQTGYDAILLTGQAAEPSIAIVDEGALRIEPADGLWGLSTTAAEKILRQKYGAEFACAVIGPAGEQRVRFATISHDGRHAGRGGSGAVLGFKNIKAVLVRGNQRTVWANPPALIELARQISQESFGPATAKYRELGTAANLLLFNRLKTLPTRNFQQASFDQAEALAPETLETIRSRMRASCAACTIGCEHLYELTSEVTRADVSATKEPSIDAPASQQVRVEYENLFALGPLCGIGDAETVLQASRLCDELGLDTISTGGTIAFAMECVERGLLDWEWLRFGDGAALLKAIQLMSARQGPGDLLAEGSRRLAEHVGRNSHDFAPHIKGLELPGYEPRTLQTMALGLAVNARGADHNRSSAYEIDFSQRADRKFLTPEAARLAIETEDRAALMDSLILCKFLRGVFDDLFSSAAEMLRLVTGWNVSADELRQVSRRVVTAKKLFNVQAGWTVAEDTLPPRFFDQRLLDVPDAALSRNQLTEAVQAYYAARGWSETGQIPEEQLEDLAPL